MSMKELAEWTRISKYARYNNEKGRRETWEEQVKRVFDMHKVKYKEYLPELENYIDETQNAMKSKLILGSQRALQFGGDPILKKHARQYNCTVSFIDRPRFFQECLYLLLCGCGAGFSNQKHHVDKLPTIEKIDKNDIIDVVIEDSIEGWSDSLGKLLSCYFTSDTDFPEFKGKNINFDFSKIRKQGSKINGTNGTAPGPEPLKRSLEKIKNIIENTLENGYNKLRPIDAYDIVMHSSDAVLSGGVRRCIAKGQRVLTKTGSYKNIEDIVVGDFVSTNDGYKKVTNTFNQGVQKTVKLIHEDGYLICTENHKVAVLKNLNEFEWKMVKDLKENDVLFFKNNKNDDTNYINKLPDYSYEKPLHSTTCKDLIIPELDIEMAWFLGIFHGDGNVRITNNHGSVSVACEATRPEKLEHIINGFKRFGANPHIKQPQENDKCYKITVSYKQLADYLTKNFKIAKQTIRIPQFIKDASPEIKIAYVQGVLDSDGYIGERNQQIVNSIYEDFVKDIQSLLQSIGIYSRYKKDSIKGLKENWNPKYSLYLLINEHRQKFNDMSQIAFKKFQVRKFDKCNTFPTKFFLEEMQIRGLKKNQFANQIDFSKETVSYGRWVKSFGEIDIIPVRFKKIEDYDELETYDIEVENNHCFICEGILVHNSATICLFSPDDNEMMKAKTGDWFITNPQRARSNNSVLLLRDELKKEYFHEMMRSVKEFGEPGIILADSTEICLNPCSEIGMWPVDEETGKTGWNFCNLSVINIKKCKTEDDFYKACYYAAVIGTLQAGYTNFEYLGKITENIVKREALLGCSITGMMDNPDISFNPEILKKGAEIIKETNTIISKIININPAARTTAIKPEGTSSCILSTASGIHPHHYKRYFRRVQVNKHEKPLEFFEMFNPNAVEESVWSANKTDKVITFLIEVPKNVRTKVDINAIDLLEKVKLVQEFWVNSGKRIDLCTQPWLSHNVSNTINVRDHEWEIVSDYIYENRKYFTGISLLPMTGDKDYRQAPFQAIYDPKELVDMYGDASVFASGLIVHAQQAFNGSLYDACDCFLGYGEKLDIPDLTNNEIIESIDKLKKILDKKTWIERARKFSRNYFNGDDRQMTYCLKDVDAWKKWCDLKREYSSVPWDKFFEDQDNTKVQETVACGGGKCEII